jgi:hypothetical protein
MDDSDLTVQRAPWIAEWIVLHGTHSASRYRLFDDWDVGMGAQSVRFAIASGSGKTSLFLNSRIAHLQSYVQQAVKSYYQTDRVFPEIGALFTGYSRGADVGFLLAGGQGRRWTDPESFYCSGSYITYIETLGFCAGTALTDTAIEFLTWPRQESTLALPADPAERGRLFIEILQTVETISSPAVLESWLSALIDNAIPLPTGMPPDSPALALIRRLLDVAADRGFAQVQKLFGAIDSPFRARHFQLSLIGTLLVRSDDPLIGLEINDWANAELERLRTELKNETMDPPTLAVIAGLLALGLVGRDNDPEEAKLFNSDLVAWLKTITDDEERRFFLQFLLDSVNQYIDKHNIADHWIKMIVLFHHIREDSSVVWPSSGLARLLRETFLEPATKVLNR